jgi:hypothetical protein
MRIFDCFIFSDEIDILEYRLDKLYSEVDQFVIVDSRQTFTGNPKPLHFKEDNKRFRKWEDKISYFICPSKSELSPWQYEFFQRNYIKTCLGMLDISDEDVVFISDVDEIINIQHLLITNISFPFRIEMSFYYYFSNLKASENWDLSIGCKWKDIRNINIGDRSKYQELFPIIIKDFENKNGSHFSHMFGYSIAYYKKKMSSFSHGEFNNFYFKNSIRLRLCIFKKKDIYERSWMNFEIDENKTFDSFSCEKDMKFPELYYPINYSKIKLFFSEKYIKILNLAYRISLRLKIINRNV